MKKDQKKGSSGGSWVYTSSNLGSKMEILVQNNGGVYSNWYVGIASDIEQRLFGDHNVDKEKGQWA